MDTAIKVALIVAVPGTLGSVGAFILGVINKNKLADLHESTAKLEISVDGRLSQLVDAQRSLGHADGRREGIELEQAKLQQPPQIRNLG